MQKGLQELIYSDDKSRHFSNQPTRQDVVVLVLVMVSLVVVSMVVVKVLFMVVVVAVVVGLGRFACPFNNIRSLCPQTLPEEINPEHL